MSAPDDADRDSERDAMIAAARRMRDAINSLRGTISFNARTTGTLGPLWQELLDAADAAEGH